MIKQLIARNLQGSRLYAPARNVFRRFSRVRAVCTRNEIAFYSQFINPGDLVFDIGANAGYKTEVFLGCGALVVAAEPNPRCHPVLDYEFAADSRVSLVKKAVGREETSLPMNVMGLATTASLLDDWAAFGVGYGNGGLPERVEVPVTTLDQMIEQYGEPSFVKIDVEGYESEVLKGLTSSVPFLSFEYHLPTGGREQLTACLEQLAQLSAIKINVILDNADSNTRELRFAFEEALPVDEFFRNPPPAGDCFVIRSVDQYS